MYNKNISMKKKNDTALVFIRTEQLVEKLKRKKEYEAVTHPLSRTADEEWNTRERSSFFPSCRNLGDVLSLKKAEHWYGHETPCTREVLPPEVLGRQCCVLKMGSRKAWEEACELLYQKYSKWYLAPVSFPQAALLLLTCNKLKCSAGNCGLGKARCITYCLSLLTWYLHLFFFPRSSVWMVKQDCEGRQDVEVCEVLKTKGWISLTVVLLGTLPVLADSCFRKGNSGCYCAQIIYKSCV